MDKDELIKILSEKGVPNDEVVIMLSKGDDIDKMKLYSIKGVNVDDSPILIFIEEGG